MKKLILFTLILILAFSLILGSCGEPAKETTKPSPQPSPSPTQTQKPTETAKPTAPTAAPTKIEPEPVKPPEPKGPYGTLKVALTTFAYETFDQIIGESFWGQSICDPIITYDAQGNVIGAACESYSLSEDGNTWTFKVRKGIKFHNGDPLTAHDIMFSVDHFKSEESTNPWSPYLRNNFRSMAVPDDYTFIYRTNKPEPPLVVPFAATLVIPKNYIEENGIEYFREHPIGSGSWKYVEGSFKSGESVEFEANTEHWRVVPAYEKMIQYLIPEESTLVAALKNGEVDIIGPISIDRTVQLRDDGWSLQQTSRPTLSNYSMPGSWITDGPTSDIRVRKAMSYAINRQEICDTLFQGLAEPGGRWFMDPYTWGWDPAWEADPYDPDLAKQLLAQANYAAKWADYEVIMNIQTGQQQALDLMQVIGGYWEKVGIKSKVVLNDAMVQLGLFFVRGTDSAGSVIPWIFGGAPNTVYHCANMYSSTGVHSTGNDPEADRLYAKATSELDPDLALQYWRDFQNYGYDMWVNTSVAMINGYYVQNPEVGEWTWGLWLGPAYAYCGIQHAE